jgi:Fe-S-cluster containining protein
MSSTNKRSLSLYVERAVASTVVSRTDLASAFERKVRVPEMARKRPTSCRPGCASCCYHPVLVTILEAIPIYRWLHAEGLWTSRLREDLARATDRQVGAAYETWLLSLDPCTLLDRKTNLCRAYEARPFACRTTYATSDPSFCHPHRLSSETRFLDRSEVTQAFHGGVEASLRTLGSRFDGLPLAFALLLAERLCEGTLAVEDVDAAIASVYAERGLTVKTTCDLCRRPKEGCETFTLTESEREAVRRMGETNTPASYNYCRPCLRLLRDPASADRFLRGVLEHSLRRAGASDPTGRAKRFVDALRAKAQGTPK